jgi:NADPH:quinone reductase-like Zn-dependent oxidoreductase
MAVSRFAILKEVEMKAIPLIGVRQFQSRSNYPDPAVSDGYTLIRVAAVGLNRLDLLTANGELGVSFPHLCGSDVVGYVEASPSGRHREGSRVIVNPALPEVGDVWPDSRSCRFVRILGAHTEGALAEYVSVPDDQVYQAPDMDDARAATLPLDFLTAWRMLITRAQVKSGETVLVWGASGPLGCAALRICQMMGARAVAVGSRPSDAEMLQSIGAAYWVDYGDPNLSQTVAAYAPDGFDVVFESVGKASWETSLEVASQGGRIVISGVTTGHSAATDLEKLYYKQVNILGSRMGYPPEFEAMLDQVASGDLLPAPVASEFPMSDIAGWFRALEERQAPGKIVLINDL